jgi:hypothetical protein
MRPHELHQKQVPEPAAELWPPTDAARFNETHMQRVGDTPSANFLDVNLDMPDATLHLYLQVWKAEDFAPHFWRDTSNVAEQRQQLRAAASDLAFSRTAPFCICQPLYPSSLRRAGTELNDRKLILQCSGFSAVHK